MRILIVTGIFPPDIGGPATYVPQVAEHLTGKGHNVTVVTLSDAIPPDDSAYPFRLVRLLRGIPRPLRMPRTVMKLFMLGRKADLLFVNGLYLESTLVSLALRKPMVQKIVGDIVWQRASRKLWTTDDFDTFQTRRYNVPVRGFRILRNWWTRRATRVIVPSHYLGKWAREWGAADSKMVVIYNGMEAVNGLHPAELPLKAAIKVVYAGRLVPWKRVDKLMDAVARIDGAGLVLIGDGPDRTALEQHSQDTRMSQRVYFAGARTKDEMMALMAACDIFVMNSTYEGLPHVLLEAMSAGLPVIATNIGGTPEVVTDGENGILIDHNDPEALEKALRSLISNPDVRERLRTNALSSIDKFSETRMLEQTESLLVSMAR
ncbi:MAG: glycosyltransferase family 4 protein [Chloroflexi bacterium]|nr:glycosyltransferase family 4 protein [Chloroflexota bacterium]